MIREHDDAVSTYIKTTITPVIPNVMVKLEYWKEVARQVGALIGPAGSLKLSKLLEQDDVMYALYKKSEQSRVDLIIMLQRTGKL